MQIKFSDSDGSLCSYYNRDEKGTILGSRYKQDCHGSPSFSKGNTTILLFAYNKVMVSEDEFQQWIMFCNLAGFKCTYSIENVDFTSSYNHFKGKFYSVTLYHDDYICSAHLFAAVTVVRMISYKAGDGRFVADSQSVITNLCNLIEKNPNQDPLKLLLLAHKDVNDSSHFLINKNYKISDITVLEMLELFKNYKRDLNNFFSSNNSKERVQFKEIIW